MKRKALFIFLEIMYVFGVVYAAATNRWSNIPLILFCMGFTFFMYYLIKKGIEPIDDGIYVTLCGFVFFASFLGSGLGFYDIIKWYDDFLHLWSGIICAQLGLVTARYFLEEEMLITKRIRIFVLVFIFFFTMGCAAIWEIFEFGVDNLLGLNMQAGGLKDTCIDMIDALIGCGLTLPHIYHTINKNNIN